MYWVKVNDCFEYWGADNTVILRTAEEPKNTHIFTEYSLAQYLNQKQINATALEFLQSTDWKVLRHLRQKNLQVAQSMTDEEYLTLEQQRQSAAATIVDIDVVASVTGFGAEIIGA